MCFEDVQKLGFFAKRDVFFSKEHLKVFRKFKHGYFPSECFPKVIIAHAISKSSKLNIFCKKKWSFLQQNPSKTSGASFSLFYGDCVSDFHNASEFSKQSKFWFVWGKRCCPRKDPCFSLESVNVAFLSQLAFQKV